MSLKALGERLVAANRDDTIEELLKNDYAADAVSVEAMTMDPARSRETAGLDGIRAKHAWWNDNMQTRAMVVEGPFLHGDDRFAVIFKGEAVSKQSGETMPLHEVAIYTAKDGKIVREEFYSAMS
ncbi:nuclear transport factor 2 family protein [Acuticoccus sp. MNP-M23]|uniref:nuclear transport factor 2 family protein n=1 Tax=Acuticoccus sp. MNP-M23 TaxID=3072793 RepID=UPI002815E2D3|nr:nuclear transport factor 2 family protein [Acuticoccus sp. MNP-M23]WMS44812.1 nuclear transport factor 2 family protein [Acuticoccus sp. MNP-M23]